MAASAGPGTRTKTKKKHFVPQRVKVLRSADPLLGVLAWGINHQVSYTHPRVLTCVSDLYAGLPSAGNGRRVISWRLIVWIELTGKEFCLPFLVPNLFIHTPASRIYLKGLWLEML
uniref:Uncharacterized protein n=1 Tax=Sphaerodactylus townsendi TaxID=933632 RepID=A0ACB8EP44_9SAUR